MSNTVQPNQPQKKRGPWERRLRSIARTGRGVLRGVTTVLRHRWMLFKPRLFQGRRIASYCQGHAVRKLHLGAGVNILDGWLNTDGLAESSFSVSEDSCGRTVFLDVSQPFPIVDNTFDYVFHEHLIEHLTHAQGQELLRECFRVLKPGGRVRIATPDFETFIALYSNQQMPEHRQFVDEYVRLNSEVWSRDLQHVRDNKPVFVINHNFRAWGHLFIYDYATIVDALRQAGFEDIARQKPKESSDANLQGLECRELMVGTFDALIVEARKPKNY